MPNFDELRLGQTATLGKTITEADILLFAAVSTDSNSIHIDAEAAAESIFHERVAHGMLSASLIGAVLGTRLPGPGTIHLNQSLSFRRPVTIGATVSATAEIIALDPVKKRVTLKTTCTVAGKVVIEGEAVVIAPNPCTLDV